LAFPAGAAFWEAFFGCLACRVVAVPVSLPRFHRDSHPIAEVCRNCRPAVLITDDTTAEQLRRRVDSQSPLANVPVVTPDQWRGEASHFRFETPSDSDLALIQYTSGSTAQPKGVQISHGNVIANLELIRARMHIRQRDDACVTWLPHYHDMGLIGSCLTTLFTQNTAWCLRPEEFVLRPARWLQLISEQRASICGGPDFAYRMCVEKITDEQAAELDLSNWRIAFVGAERIRSGTLRRFFEKFSAHGFRHEAFFPCYGLAEATLMATGGPPESPPRIQSLSARALRENRIERAEAPTDAVELVGCGRAGDGCQVVILDPGTGMPVGEDAIGEICLSGPSVTRGYYEHDDLNRELFVDVVHSGGMTTFLRTGDLGFLSQGELFVTGRLKELMIVRGRNLSPEDVEQALPGAEAGLQPGAAAAFSVDIDGAESLIIAVELRRDAVKTVQRLELEALIRRRVVEETGVDPFEVVILPPASLPRTSSGKLQRITVRSRYLDGSLQQGTGENSE
jgi:acyl-CoA synthetase (AMP-forming)/AMP-acid ligase II